MRRSSTWVLIRARLSFSRYGGLLHGKRTRSDIWRRVLDHAILERGFHLIRTLQCYEDVIPFDEVGDFFALLMFTRSKLDMLHCWLIDFVSVCKAWVFPFLGLGKIPSLLCTTHYHCLITSGIVMWSFYHIWNHGLFEYIAFCFHLLLQKGEYQNIQYYSLVRVCSFADDFSGTTA